ncbi:MAG: RraA family protein [Acidobacteriaceae bacterium]|nr:RraA family protein [Acidobacteriaceae bacterium]
MSPAKTLAPEALEELKSIDTCTISNAIEQFEVRTRNQGFANGSVRCLFPELRPVIGYAVTAHIRTSTTPIGGRCYYDKMEWWSYVRDMPGPRFLAVQDVDHNPGLGALFGEIHASIALALGCVAYLSNGSVRDLPGIRARGFQLFAGSVAVSHSYAHVVEFGKLVEIAGLQVRPGDLLHGDQHGVVSVPLSIAPEVPEMARRVQRAESELIEFCRSKEFSFDKLPEHVRRTAQQQAMLSKELHRND